ncbi:hypothetical protein [uncultured Roseibium sp.]|uniref:hypothetical protein n=1 Tax=uncultured Roseibium sp. TaxID=1936171 RepID=UPI00321805E1
MSPDMETLRRYVEGFDLPEDKKIDLIHTVWRIAESFVDRAFGDDPVQHCLELKAEKRANPPKDMVRFENKQPET